MKGLILIFSLISGVAMAAPGSTTYNCSLPNNKQLVLQFRYAGTQPILESLSIDQQSYLNQLVDNRFGTSAGAPTFAVENYPKNGYTSFFDLSVPRVSVQKEGAFSTQDADIKCKFTSPKNSNDEDPWS